MNKEPITKSEMKLIGLVARTNNKNEMNPETAKIGEVAGHYFTQNLASQIPNRKNAGVTLAAYTDYESDEHGEYTYFIGEEVTGFEAIPEGMQKLVIPASSYVKFTTPSGQMPQVVINAWLQIWQMTAEDFGGRRAYLADFEVYDQRAADFSNTSLDIYIGIK